MGTFISRVYVDLALRLKREEGQTLVEYALIGVLIAVVVAVALSGLATTISGKLGDIGSAL
ncbi:MAG TPA: Flp family type IVb pilin [Gaiellaceae bacterium]|nr:Flp family type IVb pilin [Gaiellaceae bacterium]